MNLEQERFYQMVTRLKSRAAAAQSQDDVRITEMVNGVLITRPARKYQEITNEAMPVQKEPKIIDLQEHARSKSGSVSNQGINKLKVIRDFMNRGY